MFYDEHTWGAHNSISQPGRQFVERQWEIKESYATRANLDARNLLARANNRLCQQIAVDGSSIIAFNWDNRPRTAPLEVEISMNNQLVDLANNKPVPMDIYFEKDGWRKVRFMAKDFLRSATRPTPSAGSMPLPINPMTRSKATPLKAGLPPDRRSPNRRVEEPLRQNREPRTARHASPLQAQPVPLCERRRGLADSQPASARRRRTSSSTHRRRPRLSACARRRWASASKSFGHAKTHPLSAANTSSTTTLSGSISSTRSRSRKRDPRRRSILPSHLPRKSRASNTRFKTAGSGPTTTRCRAPATNGSAPGPCPRL